MGTSTSAHANGHSSESFQHMHDCLTDACFGTHHLEQEKLLENLEHNNETIMKHIAELEEKLRKGEMNHKALQREVAAMSAMQAEEVKNQNGVNNSNIKPALELHANDLRKAQTANAQAQALVTELQARTTKTDAAVQSLHTQNMQLQTLMTHGQSEVIAINQRVAELEGQLQMEQQKNAMFAKSMQDATAEAVADALRRQEVLRDVTMVNHYLQLFASDPLFQQQLKNPKVMLALDLWGGTKNESHHTTEEIDDVRRDPIVKQVYPRMKELESACSDANIFFPIDYVRSGATELDDIAMARIAASVNVNGH